jgi:NADPH-dependent 2,4-dienoyl-CoA reductase/sulfur reductase-like enzyme
LIARTPEAFAKSGITVRLNTRVDSIRPDAQTVKLASGDTLPFDHLLLATGAAPRLPDVAGHNLEGIFTLRNVSDALRIKSFLEEKGSRRALVVGAGLVSLEMCEAFRKRGLQTTILYHKALPLQRLGPEFPRKILDELEANGVVFMANTSLKGFDRAANGGIVVQTTGATIEVDLVLIGVGVVPSVSLAVQAGIKLGPTGAVAVNDHLKTNFPFIYSAGDCCECYHRISRRPVYAPLGDVANKQGRIAGANIGGQDVTFPGIVGSFCVKVFDLEVASTGLTEEEAKESGLEATSFTIQGVSKAHAFPGAQKLWLRLVAETGSGRLLGAQAVGGNGVVSRINVMAAALTAGLSLEEVAYLDLAYAPPFSGAWDPIHIVAQQLLKE